MLYALSKVGGVLSSRVVSHTSPRSAISEMCLSFELNRSPEITEDQLAHSIDGVYIILESDRAIEGLKPIGQTKDLSTSAEDVSETDEFPKIS